jgi:la-related protein 1
MASSPNHPSAAAAPVSPPWSQIVASTPPHSSPSPPPSAVTVIDTPVVTSVNTSPIGSASVEEDLDNISGGNNADIGKRHVWSKPSNAAAASVMGAESWPALSESAKAPAKSPPPPPLELGQTSLDASTSTQLQVNIAHVLVAYLLRTKIK